MLEQRGYQKPAWYTAAEFAGTLPCSEVGSLAGRFTQAYEQLRFGGKTEAAPGLSILLEELETLPK